MKTEIVKIDTIRPHPRNARVHSDRNINAILESLLEFGQRTPIVVGRRKFILKGCGTWKAAKKAGWETITIVRAELSEQEEVAYALADNKTSDLSKFDDVALRDDLQELEQQEVDLAKTGFNRIELQSIFEAQEEVSKEGDEDKPDKISVTFTGDSVNIIRKAVSRYRRIADTEDRMVECLVEIAREYLRLTMGKKSK